LWQKEVVGSKRRGGQEKATHTGPCQNHGVDVARESGGVVIMWVQHHLGPIDFRIMDSDFGVVVVSVDRKNCSWHAVVVFEIFLLRFWIE
jgi:hypothetical protein